ncbi:MAG: PQQ-binding-like beta-propeller repeat protein, partial [Thermomicrobiales bacterium]
MDRPNQHHDEETMDWLLDDYWERLNARARPTPADRALDPDLAATVRHLHAHDNAPGPDRAFVRRLREDLTMTTAEPIALSPHPYPLLAPPNGRIPAAIARPHRESTRWRPALELIAAAALIVALIGGYFGSDRARTELRALVQGDDVSGPVAMLHGNAARTGEMPGPGPEGQPALRWRTAGFADADGVFTDPIVAGDTVYLRGERSEGINITSLAAVDVATGEIRWSVDLDGFTAGTPAVANGLVYVGTRSYWSADVPLATPAPYGTSPGALIAFDAATGEERWRYTMGASEYYSPAVSDGVVYINSEDGSLHAIDALTGESRWLAPLGSEGNLGSAASPAVVDGVVYSANNQGVLYALNAETGEVNWVAQTKGNILRTPAVADGAVYVAVSFLSAERDDPATNGWIYAFATSDGAERWSREVGNNLY